MSVSLLDLNYNKVVLFIKDLKLEMSVKVCKYIIVKSAWNR